MSFEIFLSLAENICGETPEVVVWCQYFCRRTRWKAWQSFWPVLLLLWHRGSTKGQIYHVHFSSSSSMCLLSHKPEVMFSFAVKYLSPHTASQPNECHSWNEMTCTSESTWPTYALPWSVGGCQDLNLGTDLNWFFLATFKHINRTCSIKKFL